MGILEQYLDIIGNSYSGYWNYLVSEILNPGWKNYFYWLSGLSLVVWLLEIAFPWRKDQPRIRKDFWLDGFYMFFNFFLFSLIGYNALSNIGVEAFNSFLGQLGVSNLVALEISSWPHSLQFLVMFLIADFLQWNIHRLLHRVSWLWEFHKVHHSVEAMGFAAHLRFHWMETIVYKTLQYIPLAMIGFGIKDFFLIHIFAILIGHLNHANLGWSYGLLKYILNNPSMHIWHHEKYPSGGHKFGVNFGISLSLWDYLFGISYLPRDGRDIEIGVEDQMNFPSRFFGQMVYPFV